MLGKDAFYIEKTGFPKDFLNPFSNNSHNSAHKKSLDWKPTICGRIMGHLSLRPIQVEINVTRVSGLKGQFLVTQTPN